MKIINLYSGPSSGKSTTAALLFGALKLKGINCELVTEYAKNLVWAERKKDFNHQLYITAKQHYKLEILRNQVDFVVTDSPLLFGLVYCPENYFPSYKSLIAELYESFENENFFIKRVKPYNPVGRNQNEDEAKSLDVKIKQILYNNSINYETVNGDAEAPGKIMKILGL